MVDENRRRFLPTVAGFVAGAVAGIGGYLTHTR